MEDILNQHSAEIKELLAILDDATIDLASMDNKESRPSLNGDTFLNNRQVSEKLHISQRALQDYRDKGLISFYKLEGKILYKEKDILKLLEDNYYQAWKED